MEYYKQLAYLRMLGIQLERFKETQDGVWNCRCPVCGDSKKDETKARGYFFAHNGEIVYKCHNCDYSSHLLHLIKSHFPALYATILTDKYREEGRGDRQLKEDEYKAQLNKVKERNPLRELMRTHRLLKGYKTMNKVEADNPHRQYLVNRGLEKHLHRFYYIPSVKDFAAPLEHYKGTITKDSPAIGIPHFSQDKTRLEFMQMRYIEGDAKKRYQTLRVDGLRETKKTFGLEYAVLDDKANNYYLSITEGAFDSLFVSNCIAISGISDYKGIVPVLEAQGLSRDRIRFIVDNDWRYNKQIRKDLEGIIALGCSVVIFPSFIQEKDLNDMYLSGKDEKEIASLIEANTFCGLSAKLRLAKH